MMTTQDLLQQALAAARAGKEWTARDLFLQVVEAEPKNELAWMWLTGLLDDLDDRIYACQQALGINPRNANAQIYLNKLLAEKEKLAAQEMNRYEQDFCGAREAQTGGQNPAALQILRGLLSRPQADSHPQTWRLLADLSPELSERVQALERCLAFAPQDEALRDELKQAQYFLTHPIHQAELYEERGELEKALEAYRAIALTSKDKKIWNQAYAKVLRLENAKQEHVAHVSPALHVARLTFAPLLTYILFAILHLGVNPFAHHDDPLTWLGLLWVAAGAFLVALSTVRFHHRLWLKIFKDASASGAPRTRLFLAATGWLLILLPFVAMFYSAWRRLIDYVIKLLNF